MALSASFVGASICVQWSDFEWFSIRGQSVQGQGSPDANHVHQIISYSLCFAILLTFCSDFNLLSIVKTFIANHGVKNEHYKEPVIPIHSRQLGANQRGGEGGSFSCIALIGWGLMPSDKALHPPSLPTYSFPRYSWTVIPD